MPPVLWHLEISHYNEKVRWALDYKGVPHVRRTVTPALQQATALRLGAGTTTPILEIDGRRVGDSTQIIEEIERRWPDPPLYPSDPAERSRAVALANYFDGCGDDLRRVLFHDSLAEPDKFLGMIFGADHPRMVCLLKTIYPAFAEVVKRRFDIRPVTVAQSRGAVLAAFDRIDEEVGPRGYLVGDSFTVADLTAASILGLIVVPPEFPYIKLHPDDRSAQFRMFRDSLKDHPGFKWVKDIYARDRGTSAELAAA